MGPALRMPDTEGLGTAGRQRLRRVDTAAKFSRSRCPALTLLGWNCVAKSAPRRPIAAGNVTPYVQVATCSAVSSVCG